MNKPRTLFCSTFVWTLMTVTASFGSEPDPAASASNALGLDLYHKLATGNENLCLSPYSIGSALAMTFAGADGDTKTEMMRVLHFSSADDAIHQSFSELQKSLEEMAATTAREVQQSKQSGGPAEPMTLSIANRLFAEKTFKFRDAFLSLVKANYGAPVEPL